MKGALKLELKRTLMSFKCVPTYDERLTVALMWLDMAPDHVPATIDRSRIYLCAFNKDAGYLPSEGDKFFMLRIDELRAKYGNKTLKAYRQDIKKVVKNYN